MATQQDIIAAIDASEQQLFAIADELRAKPDAPVHEGDWTVREMLCHVATTVNVGEFFRRSQAVGGAFPSVDDMDRFNDQLLAAHKDASVDDLLDEATQAYSDSRARANQLTDEEIAKSGPADPGEDPMAVGDLLVFLYNGHARSHIETLERAVGATS